ncbi:MAG: polysaccharide pyruvyl transferase family protein [Gracilimonas sp.]
MIIEIRGAQTTNKGAELMLLSVIKEITYRMPEKNITFAVEPSSNFSYSKRVEYKLLAVPRYGFKILTLKGLVKFLPERIRTDFGIISENDIDAVIDVSGFRYGDFWGLEEMQIGITDAIKKWRKKGLKVILLPQAFGPFEKKRMKKEALKILRYANLICARDEESYKHFNCIETGLEKRNLFQFPDFTPSITIEEKYVKFEDHVLIIPNSKMLKKSKNYINYLAELVEYLKDKKLNFAFLIHAGKSDYNIAKKVVEKTGINTEIIWENDPIETKKVINSSFLVIASRFHGLISGLSQGIPTISTSWSHKYEKVLEEYECKKIGLVEDLEDFSKTREKIEFMFSEYEKIQNLIKDKSEDQKRKIDEMWNKVIDILNQ